MLIKLLAISIIISFLVGCSHKETEKSKKAPHKVHNKFHHLNNK